MIDDQVIAKLDALSAEKLYLGAVRSLLEDDRFRRYLSGLKQRFEATIHQLDAIEADDVIGNASIRGARRIYSYEIAMIENAPNRIKSIDEELSLLNKERKNKTKGNEGVSNIIPPKGK